MARLREIPAVERPLTLSRSAYLRIQQAIREGTIRQGTLYSENELAATLQMSRTPVREAVITLAREGLIQIESQRGFRVRQLSDGQRREIFDLRLLLEPHVVRKLAVSAGEDDIRRLRELITGQEKLSGEGETPNFLALDEEFHLLMPQLVGLDRTHDILMSLRGAMWLMGFQALALPQRHSAVIAEHRAVVDAIAGHDPERAAMAIHDHVTKTAAAVF